jgi:hypothetical protein
MVLWRTFATTCNVRSASLDADPGGGSPRLRQGSDLRLGRPGRRATSRSSQAGVTNAIRHETGRGHFRQLLLGHLRVYVHDSSRTWPVPLNAGPDAEAGRG